MHCHSYILVVISYLVVIDSMACWKKHAIQNPTRCKLFFVIKFSSAEGNTGAVIHHWIVPFYDEDITWQNVTRCTHEFNEEFMEVHDMERSGHPSFFSNEML